MEKSKIPLTTWFKCIYLFVTAKRGISSCQMAKWLGVTQRTAWFMIQRLAEAANAEGDIILNGIVEVDETTISPDLVKNRRLLKKRKEYYQEQEKIHGLSPYRQKKQNPPTGPVKRGRKKGTTQAVVEERKKLREQIGERVPFELKMIVFGMCERQGRIVFKKLGKSMKDITQMKIYPHIDRHVSPDATLVSDEHVVYFNVGQFVKEHLTVNHKIGYVVDGIHSNNIENAWTHLKKVLAGTHFHLSFQHLDRYLNIHAFRWNRRQSGERAMVDDLIQGLFEKRLTYKDLTCQGHIKEAA